MSGSLYVWIGSKTSKAQNEQMLSGLAPIADMRDEVLDFRLVPVAAVINRSKAALIQSPRRREPSMSSAPGARLPLRP